MRARTAAALRAGPERMGPWRGAAQPRAPGCPARVRPFCLAVLLAVLLAAGCGQPGNRAAAGAGAPANSGAPRSGQGSGATGGGTAATRSPVAGLCGPPAAPGRLVHVRAADGVRLAGATAGTGERGVLLIPELGRAGMCGWWDYAAYLSRVGYRVLIFDHRCTGMSACPAGAAGGDLMADIRGAAAWLRRAGARRVVLLGASQGGSEAVIAAARPPRGTAGVVALSADELSTPLARAPYPRTALAAAPRLRLPALFAVAAGDPNVSVADTRRLVARAGTADKRLVVLPAGAGHGWDLVSLSYGRSTRPPLSRVVVAFLMRVTA